jgi:DNA polymerase elongation subunit (family B)
MSFFNSELVRAEMAEISTLQEDVYKNVFEFPRMSKDEKLFHVSLLEKLLNKQQVLYTRLKLSDDPEAIQMKERIKESAQMMGLPPDVDMSVIFNNMTQLLETMKERIDKTGSDL